MDDVDIITCVLIVIWISLFFYINYLSVNFDDFLSSNNATIIIKNIISFIWFSFLVYMFYWIIDFSFYKTKNGDNKSNIPVLQCIFCGLYAFLFIVCMNTIPSNNVISGWWFFGIGFIGVIFGFIYYFNYLKELGMAFFSDQKSEDKSWSPQQHFITVFSPILRFIINNKKDKKGDNDDNGDNGDNGDIDETTTNNNPNDIKNFDNEKLLYTLSIYANKIVDVVIK